MNNLLFAFKENFEYITQYLKTDDVFSLLKVLTDYDKQNKNTQVVKYYIDKLCITNTDMYLLYCKFANIILVKKLILENIRITCFIFITDYLLYLYIDNCYIKKLIIIENLYPLHHTLKLKELMVSNCLIDENLLTCDSIIKSIILNRFNITKIKKWHDNTIVKEINQKSRKLFIFNNKPEDYQIPKSSKIYKRFSKLLVYGIIHNHDTLSKVKNMYTDEEDINEISNAINCYNELNLDMISNEKIGEILYNIYTSCYDHFEYDCVKYIDKDVKCIRRKNLYLCQKILKYANECDIPIENATKNILSLNCCLPKNYNSDIWKRNFKLLTNLQSLSLMKASLDIYKINELELHSLQNLKELDLSYNRLYQTVSLKSLNNLERLNLSNNKLYQIHLVDLKKLRYVNLNNNLQLRDVLYVGKIHLPESVKELSIMNCPKLTNLSIGFNVYLECLWCKKTGIPQKIITDYIDCLKILKHIS